METYVRAIMSIHQARVDEAARAAAKAVAEPKRARGKSRSSTRRLMGRWRPAL